MTSHDNDYESMNTTCNIPVAQTQVNEPYGMNMICYFREKKINNKDILSSSDSNNSRYLLLSTDATRCISSESISYESTNHFTVKVNSVQISCYVSISSIEFHKMVHEKLNELEKKHC